MPLIHVTLTPNAFDAAGCSAFVRRISDAALRAESVPDTPEGRRRCIVILHEQPPGTVFWGGEAHDGTLRAAFLDFTCSRGVLDGARKDRFAAELREAALASATPEDSRPVFTSVVFHEIAEGDWGRDGTIHRLPQMAAIAGFEHLRSIAAA